MVSVMCSVHCTGLITSKLLVLAQTDIHLNLQSARDKMPSYPGPVLPLKIAIKVSGSQTSND